MTKLLLFVLLLTNLMAIYPVSQAIAAKNTEKPFENPGDDAPALELPASVVQLAQAVIDATSLNAAIDAVETAFAQGGVAVNDGNTRLNQPVQPLASTYVEAVNLADIALEAQDRTSAAALTAQQLAGLLADFGWPSKNGKDPTSSFMLFLKTWLQAALKNPDDPSHFAILFIAANNQLQAPRANLLWSYQVPELVRFSRMELDLLAAAFDRALVTPASTKAISGACGPVRQQFGKWDDSAAIGAAQLTDSALSQALAALYGPSVGGLNTKTKAALNAFSLAAKTFKFSQLLHYGTLSAHAEGADTLVKPFQGQPAQTQKLTAQVGLDAATYADYQAWIKQSSAQSQANNKACLDYLGIANTTLTDSVSDIKNWRVEWSMGAGFDQVRWQNQPQTLELKSLLTADNATEASSAVNYLVESQTSKAASSDTRERTAVFTAKLTPANYATLWGQGLSGFTSASANSEGYQHFTELMGLTRTSNKPNPPLVSADTISLMADTVAEWALEVTLPKRKVKKKFKENKPKYWAGTIEIAYVRQSSALKNTHDATRQLDESVSSTTTELTVFTVDQKDPYSGGDKTFAETECAHQYISSNKERTNDLEGLDWSPINEYKTIHAYSVTSGKINAAIEFRIWTAFQIAFILTNITDPKERDYWLKKSDTWELYAYAPTCNDAEGKATHTYFMSEWDYDTKSQSWKYKSGSPSTKVYHANVYSHINADIAGTPLLSGPLVNNGFDIPKVIDQASVIKKDDSKKSSSHTLHTVSAHLYQVQ